MRGGAVAIPITFTCSDYDPKRPAVTFTPTKVSASRSVDVTGNSEGGWVFCQGPSDNYLTIEGGTIDFVSGFSGDESEIVFTVTHDGFAKTILITYCTRAD